MRTQPAFSCRYRLSKPATSRRLSFPTPRAATRVRLNPARPPLVSRFSYLTLSLPLSLHPRPGGLDLVQKKSRRGPVEATVFWWKSLRSFLDGQYLLDHWRAPAPPIIAKWNHIMCL